MSGGKKWWELWGPDTATAICGTKKVKFAEDGEGVALYNTVPDFNGEGISFDEGMTVTCADCGWTTSGQRGDAALLREAVLHERKCSVARERRFSEAIERLTAALTKERSP